MNRVGEGKLKILRPIFPFPQIFHLTTQTLIPNESIGANFHSNSRQQHENFARNSSSCSDSTFFLRDDIQAIENTKQHVIVVYDRMEARGKRLDTWRRAFECVWELLENERVKQRLHKDEIEASNTSLKDPTCCTRCRRAVGIPSIIHRPPSPRTKLKISSKHQRLYVAYQEQEHRACIPLVDSFLFIHSGMT